jgi:hypothetical protein
MNDDLVKRLRVRAEFTGPYSALWDEAADRIEKLEAALRALSATCDCWAAVEERGKIMKLLEGNNE